MQVLKLAGKLKKNYIRQNIQIASKHKKWYSTASIISKLSQWAMLHTYQNGLNYTPTRIAKT